MSQQRRHLAPPTPAADHDGVNDRLGSTSGGSSSSGGGSGGGFSGGFGSGVASLPEAAQAAVDPRSAFLLTSLRWRGPVRLVLNARRFGFDAAPHPTMWAAAAAAAANRSASITFSGAADAAKDTLGIGGGVSSSSSISNNSNFSIGRDTVLGPVPPPDFQLAATLLRAALRLKPDEEASAAAMVAFLDLAAALRTLPRLPRLSASSEPSSSSSSSRVDSSAVMIRSPTPSVFTPSRDAGAAADEATTAPESARRSVSTTSRPSPSLLASALQSPSSPAPRSNARKQGEHSSSSSPAVNPASAHLCFWVNLYHALLQHALLLLGPPQSARDWGLFHASVSYEVFGNTFSLVEIEHCVLRSATLRGSGSGDSSSSNSSCSSSISSGSSSIGSGGKVAGAVNPSALPKFYPTLPPHDDERRAYGLGGGGSTGAWDPRLNFVLHNGTVGSGGNAVAVLEPSTLTAQLNARTTWVLEHSVRASPAGVALTPRAAAAGSGGRTSGRSAENGGRQVGGSSGNSGNIPRHGALFLPRCFAMYPGDFSTIAPPKGGGGGGTKLAPVTALQHKQRVVDCLKFCLMHVGRGQWQRLSLLLPESSGSSSSSSNSHPTTAMSSERVLAAYRPPQVSYAPMRFVSYDALAEMGLGEGHLAPGESLSSNGGGVDGSGRGSSGVLSSNGPSAGTTPQRRLREHLGSVD